LRIAAKSLGETASFRGAFVNDGQLGSVGRPSGASGRGRGGSDALSAEFAFLPTFVPVDFRCIRFFRFFSVWLFSVRAEAHQLVEFGPQVSFGQQFVVKPSVLLLFRGPDQKLHQHGEAALFGHAPFWRAFDFGLDGLDYVGCASPFFAGELCKLGECGTA
jgi:hypothetical protein